MGLVLGALRVAPKVAAICHVQMFATPAATFLREAERAARKAR